MALPPTIQDREFNRFVDNGDGTNSVLVNVTGTFLPTGAATETTLAAVLAAVDGLEGFNDGVEGLLTTIRDNADTVETLLASLGTNTDGVEALLTTIRDNADQVEGFVDGVEGLLTSILAEMQLKADLTESQPVIGPATNAELRATPLPVSLPNNNVLINGNSAFYAQSLSALGTFFTEDFNGYKEIRLTVFGAFVGSVVIEGTGNNTDWVSIPYLNAASATTPPTTAAITVPGVFYAPLNVRWIRVRLSAYTSGTVTCFAVANTATGSPDLGAKFVTGPVTNTELRATPVPVSGTVTANAGTGTFAVSGPLTDAQLRAAAVPVSGPLTDTQLRASAVPISGTVTANAGTGTFAVSGPLTDAQLRAATVPVSGTVTANAGTNLNTSALNLETTQSSMSAKLPATLGQKTMAASMAVTMASDQTDINTNISKIVGVTPSATNSMPSRLTDGTGFISSLVIGANRYLTNAMVQNVTVSAANSSTANLVAGATFTGTSVGTLGVGAIQVNLRADQACTIQIQQSTDGTNWDIVDSYTVAASTGDGRTHQAVSSFVRVLVTNNGASTTTFLRLQTLLTPTVEVLPRTLTQNGNLKTSVQEALPAGTNSIGSVSLGTSTGKTNVMQAGTLITTSGTANQVVHTYTVTAGKTFYMTYFRLDVRITIASATATNFGTSSLESPAATKLITHFNAGGGFTMNPGFIFTEPIPFAAETVVRAVCSPAATTGFTWFANFGGYEK